MCGHATFPQSSPARARPASASTPWRPSSRDRRGAPGYSSATPPCPKPTSARPSAAWPKFFEIAWRAATMSFKTYEQIQFAQSIYVPRPFTWENYTGLWLETRFPIWFRNSVVTGVVVTIITTVIACLSGYAVARLRFPRREAIATLILVLYLVPPALLFIPLYRVLAELGTTNSLIALFL